MKKELLERLRDRRFPGITESNYPTLSDLIRECGEQFSELIYFNDSDKEELNYEWVKESGRWHSEYRNDGNIMNCASGHTPEESVARLWLSLKGKDSDERRCCEVEDIAEK